MLSLMGNKIRNFLWNSFKENCFWIILQEIRCYVELIFSRKPFSNDSIDKTDLFLCSSEQVPHFISYLTRLQCVPAHVM